MPDQLAMDTLPASTAELAELRRRVARAEERIRGTERQFAHITKMLETINKTLRDNLEDDEDTSEFDTFLVEHPELTRKPDLLGELDDQQLLDALGTATAEHERQFRGVLSHDVAHVLCDGTLRVSHRERSWPSESDIIRVGRALGRLARAGRVRRVTHPAESPQVWLPVGEEVPR
jgi:hypothetical protein